MKHFDTFGLNAIDGIAVELMVTTLSELQPRNAWSPILVTDHGMCSAVMPVPSKAFPPIAVTEGGIITPSKLVSHFLKLPGVTANIPVDSSMNPLQHASLGPSQSFVICPGKIGTTIS